MMRKTSRNSNWSIFALIVPAMLLGLTGCGKKETPASPPAAAKPKPSGLKSAPVMKPLSSAVKGIPGTDVKMTTDFVSHKDPFKPLVADSKSGAPVKRNRFGQALPILNYELSQFKVTGIIVGMKENSAQVVDPTGKPYIVKAGMEIGRNEGRITKITPSYVEVFERYRDESGKLIKNHVRLALPKKQ